MRSRIAISTGSMVLQRCTPSFPMNDKWLLGAIRLAGMSGCAEFPAKQSELITELDPPAMGRRGKSDHQLRPEIPEAAHRHSPISLVRKHCALALRYKSAILNESGHASDRGLFTFGLIRVQTRTNDLRREESGTR
jgi:hypothetical protein